MRNLILFIIVLTFSNIKAQENDGKYFFIDGEKYLKPIKYILFNSNTDEEKKVKEFLFFYIQGETFKFSYKKHKMATCDIKYFKKITLEHANELADKEYLFYTMKVHEIKDWKEKKLGSMPPARAHPYFKVFIIKKTKDKVIKYEVDWEYSHSYR